MLQRFVDQAAVEAEIAHVQSLFGNALRGPVKGAKGLFLNPGGDYPWDCSASDFAGQCHVPGVSAVRSRNDRAGRK